MNVYDFDKTIYDGDSSIDFYLFSMSKKPYIIVLIPLIFWGYILYKLKIKDKEYFKEMYFKFVMFFPNIEELVNNFWDKNEYKIKKWYLDQRRLDDLIITASPYFLIREIASRLGIKHLIASEVNQNTGVFISKNCYGKEKVNRYKSEYHDKKIKNFYSDSLSDMPMMELSENAYLVKKDSIENIYKKK